MFGLSKKEKLLKIVSNAADARLDEYREGLRELIIKEMKGEISEKKYEEKLKALQEQYNYNVAETAVEEFSRAYPDKRDQAYEYPNPTRGIHKLYSYLCKVLTGQEIIALDQYSMMTAQEKGFEIEEKAIRDSLA